MELTQKGSALFSQLAKRKIYFVVVWKVMFPQYCYGTIYVLPVLDFLETSLF